MSDVSKDLGKKSPQDNPDVQDLQGSRARAAQKAREHLQARLDAKDYASDTERRLMVVDRDHYGSIVRSNLEYLTRAEPAKSIQDPQGYEDTVDDLATKAGVLKKGKVTVTDMGTGKEVKNTRNGRSYEDDDEPE